MNNVSEEQFIKDISCHFDKDTLDSLTPYGIQFLHQAIKIYKNEDFTRDQLVVSLEEITNNSSDKHGDIVDWFMDYCDKVHKTSKARSLKVQGKNFLFNKSIKAISKQKVGQVNRSGQQAKQVKIEPIQLKKVVVNNGNVEQQHERILRIGKDNEKGKQKSTLKIISRKKTDPKAPCLNLEVCQSDEECFSGDEVKKHVKGGEEGVADQNEQFSLLLQIVAAALQKQQLDQYEQKSGGSNQQRCKFFPNCQKPNCSYLHPTQMCRYFPHCKRGASCIFLHQQCRHGIHCQNVSCGFEHPKGRANIEG